MTCRRAQGSVTHRVFLDLSIAGQPIGRLTIGLYGNAVPRTAENFRKLCTGELARARPHWHLRRVCTLLRRSCAAPRVASSGPAPPLWLHPAQHAWQESAAHSRKKGAPRLHFRGVALHRIVPGFLCQGGDITHDRDGTGLGGASVYGGTFEDEGFPLKHRGRGELLMANAGRAHNNHSQFAITMARITEFESGHVIFGRVLDGFEALRLAELEGSAEGFTERPVVIHDCGELDARGEAIEVVGGDSVVRRRPELSDAQVRYFTTRILRGALAYKVATISMFF